MKFLFFVRSPIGVLFANQGQYCGNRCVRDAYMNYFSSDKMTGTHEDRRCSHCDTQPKLVYQMLDSRSGKTIRMFECKCGERSWDQ
jgi:hypothetical protein